MQTLYIYVVVRDFGFAPNPFHGICSLATCKPGIRKSAQVDDWVMGVGGCRLNATGRCIFLMKITEIATYNSYWSEKRFRLKRPLRNGSAVMMVGDNIYHQKEDTGEWFQEDSHHSNPDGTLNSPNVKRDTSSDRILLSTHFYYFGSAAPTIDLTRLNYKNVRSYRKISWNKPGVERTIIEFEERHQKDLNLVLADPFDFSRAQERVDQSTGKLS